MKYRSAIFAISTVMALAAQNASATDYAFTVTCPREAVVEVWQTGDIDPGKEYLRVITGVNNPGCSVGDYQESTDQYLPVKSHSGVPAVFEGIPPIEILKDIFGF